MAFVKLQWDELSATVRGVLPADAAPEQRLAVAKGLIPLSARDILSTLYFLCGDEDPRVRKTAKAGLRELPETLTLVGLSGDVSPKLLHFLATRAFDNHHIHERVALHPKTAHDSLAHLAGVSAHERVIDIIGKNEAAILISPAILHRLVLNAFTPRSLVDRLTRFYETAKGRPYTADLSPELQAEIGILPTAPEPLVEEPLPPIDGLDETLHPCFRIEDLLHPDFELPDLFAEDLIADRKADPAASGAETGEAPQEGSIHARIARMSFVDRLLLALKGNLEARRFLVKSSNKTLQDCVLRNPRFSIGEVSELAKERSTSANVVQAIANNREWTRYYEVAHRLCWNPKTPIRFVLQFLSRLTPKDLEKIAFSKMVPTTTAGQARNLLRRREQRS